MWDLASCRVIHVADVVFDETSFGGRTRTQSFPELSTILRDSDEIDQTVTGYMSPLQSTRMVLPEDCLAKPSRQASIPTGQPRPSERWRPKHGRSFCEVDDTSGGKFTSVLEDRVSDSDVPNPGTQNSDSPMPLDMSTESSITFNGMAPEEGEPSPLTGRRWMGINLRLYRSPIEFGSLPSG